MANYPRRACPSAECFLVVKDADVERRVPLHRLCAALLSCQCRICPCESQLADLRINNVLHSVQHDSAEDFAGDETEKLIKQKQSPPGCLPPVPHLKRRQSPWIPAESENTSSSLLISVRGAELVTGPPKTTSSTSLSRELRTPDKLRSEALTILFFFFSLLLSFSRTISQSFPEVRMLSTGVVFFVALVVSSSAFKNGARMPPDLMMDSMCSTGDFRPHHPRTGPLMMPQHQQAPYVLEVDRTSYGPNTVIKVTLKGDNVTTHFKGFFITIDAADAKMGVKGDFTPADPPQARRRGGPLSKPTTFCMKGITHTGNTNKNSVVIAYRAPANFTHGNMQFKATVVKDFRHFYTGIRSPQVNAVGSVTETEYTKRRMASGMGGMGGLLGGLNLSDMMKKMMSNMGGAGGAGGIPMMGGMPGLPMNRGGGNQQRRNGFPGGIQG
ncbi:uncharacterized protein LOC143302035 [Babylonia areolata]|uniref:uncharacterized protein LOC143302035 n=1 Tax=Babylonia areolata TaxID=304850 RepID=UPI003FCF47A3